MTRRRQVLAFVLSVAALLGTAACGGLPTDGPVTEGLRLDEPIIDSVRVIPQAPSVGATQEQIVRGFIRANEDLDENRATGKSYLAPQSPDLWRWTTEGITVYDTADALTVTRLGPEQLEVSTVAVATVSPDGRYRELPKATRVAVVFGLTKVSGEWRIELPRNGFGLWLDSAAFDRLYSPREIFYVTPSGRSLVPDVRWFPTGPRMVTTLARAQLGPVPDYLRGALTTGVPATTKLAVNSVPIENGRAQVNLSAAALEADPIERASMWAQLAATLGQVPAVDAVGLAVEGVELELPGVGPWVSGPSALDYRRPSPPTYDTALVRSGETFNRVDPRAIPDDRTGPPTPGPTPTAGDPPPIPQGWTRLALSDDGKEVAAVGGDRKQVSRWRDGKAVTVPFFAGQLTPPTYDSAGYLWMGGVDRAGNAGIWALHADITDPGEVPHRLTVPWLAGRTVVTVAVSPEGSRVLIISTDAAHGDMRLDVAGVVRSPSGEPTSVAAPWRQAEPLTLMRDVVWLDDESYAVLGRIGQRDPIRPWTGSVGAGLDGIRRQGPSNPEDTLLAPVPGAVSITTVGGSRGIMIVTDTHQVHARAGRTWPVIANGTDVLVPGR
jgi:hypothetical protein